MARSRQLAQHVPARTAWPTLQVLEPMTGDFGVVQPSNLSNIAPYEDVFLNLYTRAITLGEFCWTEWSTWAQQCGIPTTPWQENSAPVCAQELLSLELMSDICEDFIPHIGLFVDELIWNGQGRLNLWRLGGAIASTLPLLKHGHCALYKMSEQHPKLREPLHKSLTAHHRTPTMLWQKSAHTANPMLTLGDQHIPRVVQNLDTIDSEYFIAKIIFMKNDTSTGYANFVLPIPESVASDLQLYLKTRLLLLWFRYRRHNFKICIEDILRERSDVIYRSFFELK